jgi:hypothetical protein
LPFVLVVWAVYEQVFVAALDLHDDELAGVRGALVLRFFAGFVRMWLTNSAFFFYFMS